ncbi:MAG TPA: hypothetical protein VF094_03660 [Gaiellaceae bacterium]
MTTLDREAGETLGVCRARRRANESTLAMALRYGATSLDVLQFRCECGRFGCDLLVLLELGEFDPLTLPGSVTARHA